jgi:hypothetical protein
MGSQVAKPPIDLMHRWHPRQEDDGMILFAGMVLAALVADCIFVELGVQVWEYIRVSFRPHQNGDIHLAPASQRYCSWWQGDFPG